MMISFFSVPIDSAALLEFIRTGKLQPSFPLTRGLFPTCAKHAAGRTFVAWARRKAFHRSSRHKGIDRRQAILAPGRQELIFPGCDSGSVLAYPKNGKLAGPASSSHDLAGPACK